MATKKATTKTATKTTAASKKGAPKTAAKKGATKQRAEPAAAAPPVVLALDGKTPAAEALTQLAAAGVELQPNEFVYDPRLTGELPAETKLKKVARRNGADLPHAILVLNGEAPAHELTVELDEAQPPAAPPAGKRGASKATRKRASAALRGVRSELEAEAAAPPPPAPAAGKRGARKGRTAQPAASGGGSRTAKLLDSALAIYQRIAAATPAKPVTRGELATNADRNIARGLAKLNLVVRLEEGKGRNIRYHQQTSVTAAEADAAIRAEVANNPATFQ